MEPVIDNGIETSFNGRRVPIDSTINFTCRADGIPTPTLIWYRNDTIITTTGRTTVLLDTNGPVIRTQVPTSESVISTVILRDVQTIDDYTVWTCRVENSVGSQQYSYTLRVEENESGLLMTVL